MAREYVVSIDRQIMVSEDGGYDWGHLEYDDELDYPGPEQQIIHCRDCVHRVNGEPHDICLYGDNGHRTIYDEMEFCSQGVIKQISKRDYAGRDCNGVNLLVGDVIEKQYQTYRARMMVRGYGDWSDYVLVKPVPSTVYLRLYADLEDFPNHYKTPSDFYHKLHRDDGYKLLDRFNEQYKLGDRVEY